MSEWLPIQFYSSGEAKLMTDGVLIWVGWYSHRSFTWQPDGREPSHYMHLPRMPPTDPSLMERLREREQAWIRRYSAVDLAEIQEKGT